MNKYIGCEQQIYGVEESRLVGGRGDGMRLFNVRNGKGLEFTVSADRCADISRLSFKGDNFGYFAPCGYVAPQYYDKDGVGFLKSFTAGFFTTCGLTAVGSPCTDDGEELPLHGTIANTPCENIRHWIEDNAIHVVATVRDAEIFSHKLLLEREYIIYLDKNEITLTDTIKNIGSNEWPLEILYHCNMGYPLLSENSIVNVPNKGVVIWVILFLMKMLLFQFHQQKLHREMYIQKPELIDGVRLKNRKMVMKKCAIITLLKVMQQFQYLIRR